MKEMLIIPILQMRKLRYRVIKCFAQNFIAGKWQNKDSKLGVRVLSDPLSKL